MKVYEFMSILEDLPAGAEVIVIKGENLYKTDSVKCLDTRPDMNTRIYINISKGTIE